MRRQIGALLVAVVASAACGGYANPKYEVTKTVVSDEATQSIRVWAPDAVGPWPVVFAVPGSVADAQDDYDTLATELAASGVVVFATDWRTSEPIPTLVKDVECGYRYVRTIAEEHGGDLTQPVTFVGFSLGGTAVLYHGIDAQFGPDGSYDECFEGSPRPDVLIAVAGCHKRYDFPVGMGVWGNPSVEVTLVSGSDDTNCLTVESEHAEATLLEQGYDVRRVEVADANHGEFVYRDAENDWEPLPSDHAVGQELIGLILDAIGSAR